MITTVIGAAILIGLVVGIYLQIPAEDPETIAAREKYGKAK